MIKNSARSAPELGVGAFVPVTTERTQPERVNRERLFAHAVAAAEQSERLSVPEIRPPAPLAAVLASWDAGRRLVVCDETGAVRRHVNLFVNTDHVRDRDGLDTALVPGDEIIILPAVSGG